MLDQYDLQLIQEMIREQHEQLTTNLAEQFLKPSFDEVFRRLDQHDQRFEIIDQRLDRIDQRLNGVELDMVTKDYLDQKLDELRQEFRLQLQH